MLYPEDSAALHCPYCKNKWFKKEEYCQIIMKNKEEQPIVVRKKIRYICKCCKTIIDVEN